MALTGGRGLLNGCEVLPCAVEYHAARRAVAACEGGFARFLFQHPCCALNFAPASNGVAVTPTVPLSPSLEETVSSRCPRSAFSPPFLPRLKQLIQCLLRVFQGQLPHSTFPPGRPASGVSSCFSSGGRNGHGSFSLKYFSRRCCFTSQAPDILAAHPQAGALWFFCPVSLGK